MNAAHQAAAPAPTLRPIQLRYVLRTGAHGVLPILAYSTSAAVGEALAMFGLRLARISAKVQP